MKQPYAVIQFFPLFLPVATALPASPIRKTATFCLVAAFPEQFWL
jgi:hypothetical protein